MLLSVLIFMLICIGMQFLIIYILYEMSISRIVNTRLTRLKCQYAEKELRYNNLLEKQNKLKEKILKGYKDDKLSMYKIDKLKEKESKCVKDIYVINKQMIKITKVLEEINKYKKD